jgi:Ser/Thr protein kinase RdoA (MazF antagonist)
VDVREFGNGNINRTFLVTRDDDREDRFILQRINTQVFSRPDLVMRNMRIATVHIQEGLERSPLGPERRWEVPRVLAARDGSDHWTGPDGSFWRAMSFVDAVSFDTIRGADHAREVGYALGMFHTLLSDLPAERLADTLEGFHVTPRYLRHYDEVLAKCGTEGSPDVQYCRRFVSERRALAPVLENARAAGRLILRVIHGDPKVNNIMMDTAAGKAVSIIDLDTVKPGLVHYDIGDCLRSGSNPLGEETGAWEKVRFDIDSCRAILEGYLQTARKFLTEDDFAYLYDSMRLIAFELGLRFFTDHLEGDVYFKVKGPEHNLARALVQFRLTRSIEEQETAIRAIIGEMR